MDTTAVGFTMWIGSWCLTGTDVFVGRALASDKACASVYSVRPTIDAKYEVVTDDTADQ